MVSQMLYCIVQHLVKSNLSEMKERGYNAVFRSIKQLSWQKDNPHCHMLVGYLDPLLSPENATSTSFS